jgi:hypothetical protein
MSSTISSQQHEALSDDASAQLHGNCHCGAIKFELAISTPVKEIFHCNCSHCVKLDGYWLGYDALPADAFKITKGEDKLVEYRYGPKVASFKVRLGHVKAELWLEDLILTSCIVLFDLRDHAPLFAARPGREDD